MIKDKVTLSTPWQNIYRGRSTASPSLNRGCRWRWFQ